jgi:flagella basal body P-ring formation protein FlgA
MPVAPIRNALNRGNVLPPCGNPRSAQDRINGVAVRKLARLLQIPLREWKRQLFNKGDIPAQKRQPCRDTPVTGAACKSRMKYRMPSTIRKFVGFLTQQRDCRQITDGAKRRAGRQLPYFVASLATLLIANGTVSADGVAQSSSWHPTEDIARTAEAFLRQKLGQADPRLSLQAGWLDPRVQMPRCTQELSGFLRRGTRVASRTVVGVRCEGGSPWKMYVTVDVVVRETVLVAARTLPSGHVVTGDDVRSEERDVSGMVGGYLSRADELVGQHLKNQIMAGRVITPAMLQADLVIRRGQSVTILVRNESLNISMAGKALTDGAVNQRIKVENLASRRIVEGLVRSPEHVEVLVY